MPVKCSIAQRSGWFPWGKPASGRYLRPADFPFRRPGRTLHTLAASIAIATLRPGPRLCRVQLRTRLSFQGRFGRKLFWQNWLGAILLMVLVMILQGVLALAGTAGSILGAIITLAGIFMAAWWSLATQVKRWHDLGHSGWMVLLNFIPVLGFIICVINLGFLKGKPGPNRFDPATATPAAPPVAPAITAAPAPAAGEPPPLIAPAPARKLSQTSRRIIAATLGLLTLVVLGGAAFFVAVPGADWATRRSWCKATLGSPVECQAMAWRYRSGRGLPQNFTKAAQWFQRAADKGVAAAQYDLAVLHFYGLGVPADPDKARPLLEAAVQQNYVPAMTLLGLCYATEVPDWQDTVDARGPMVSKLWEQAAAAGDPWAESLLGSACLARRTKGDGKENLILGLYWLESARRHGVETVGGLLQHVWATVPAEDLEHVTGQVFGRLEKGNPDPLPEETVTAAPELTPPAETSPASETPTTTETTPMENTAPAADTPAPGDASKPNDPSSPTTPPVAETPENAPSETLAGEVLAKMRSLPEYVSVSTLYAEKSQADPNWPATDEGKAVGQYLQTMRSDAQAVSLQSGSDDKATVAYAVGGNALSTEVRAGDLANNPVYRQSLVDALAQNIVRAPRSLLVAEFLKQAGGGAK